MNLKAKSRFIDLVKNVQWSKNSITKIVDSVDKNTKSGTKQKIILALPKI